MELSNFLEHLSKLDNVHQWEERDSAIKESVSQHSFKVSAIAHYLLTILEDRLTTRDELIDGKVYLHWVEFKTSCLSYAILHDFDEAIIGRDISHVVKYNPYNGEKIREAINDFVNHQETLDFQGLLPKPTEIVKRFVKICDWIALSTFCRRNNDLGCKTFERETKYCEKNTRESIAAIVPLFLQCFNYDVLKLLNKVVISD